MSVMSLNRCKKCGDRPKLNSYKAISGGDRWHVWCPGCRQSRWPGLSADTVVRQWNRENPDPDTSTPEQLGGVR